MKFFGVAETLLKGMVPGSDVALKGAKKLLAEKAGSAPAEPFENRDADQFGAARYSIPQTRADDEVVDLQFALAKAGYLNFATDIDGCVGGGTLSAISRWESDRGVDFCTGEKLGSAEGDPISQGPIMLTPRLPHKSQASDDVGDILIPGLAPDGKTPLNRPVRQIGCLSCGLVGVWNFFSDDEIDFADGIQKFIDQGCYNKSRDLIWDSALSVISEATSVQLRHRAITQNEVADYLRTQSPVLCHAGRGHWVVAVGHRNDLGIIYNDPATQFGDAYADPVRNSQLQGAKRYVFDRYEAIV